MQSSYAINNEQDSPYISSQRENETYICSVGTLTRSSRLATNLDPRPSNAQLSHFYNFFLHKILVYLALIYNYNTIIYIFFISPQQHAGNSYISKLYCSVVVDLCTNMVGSSEDKKNCRCDDFRRFQDGI